MHSQAPTSIHEMLRFKNLGNALHELFYTSLPITSFIMRLSLSLLLDPYLHIRRFRTMPRPRIPHDFQSTSLQRDENRLESSIHNTQDEIK